MLVRFVNLSVNYSDCSKWWKYYTILLMSLSWQKISVCETYKHFEEDYKDIEGSESVNQSSMLLTKT